MAQFSKTLYVGLDVHKASIAWHRLLRRPASEYGFYVLYALKRE
jgi:hypothetical protein